MAPRRKKPRLSNEGSEAADISEASSQTRSLFVRALAPNTTSYDLTEHFSQSFPVKHAVAVLDKTTQQCKGYGFVTLADAEDASRAKDELNGSEIHGRKLQLDLAAARHREPGDVGAHTANSVIAQAKAEREKQKIADRKPPKLIVRNLPWSIKDPDQLAVLFRSFGKVKDVTIPRKRNGLMSGFGFVLLRGRKNAQKAMDSINGKEIDGRTLVVDWAVDKETWEAANQEDTGENGEKTKPKQNKGGDDEDSMSSVDSEAGGVQIDSLNSDSDQDSGSDPDEDGEEDEEDEQGDVDGDSEIVEPPKRLTDNSATIFIRNLPFTCTDETLAEHFSQFGDVRYARIVIDRETERPKGTGFVCFKNPAVTETCIRSAPRVDKTQVNSKPSQHSVLQDEGLDMAGQYTMEGRVLQVTRAVDRTEAARLTAEGVALRGERDKDKRHLYLLSEGTISTKSPLFAKLSPSEIAMREASAKQRRTLVETNPSLHLSLTRLSVRNLPRSITSKDLKTLAREAVVGFAKDVKAGKRQPLSKEELARGREEMKEAEHDRKVKSKGIVRQAKVVFESKEGSKVEEASGGGRSRGYGFIEYYTHRSALMGLRWLNGHAVHNDAKEGKEQQAGREPAEERKKRTIVEFALENAQVVKRRLDREIKTRDKPHQPDTHSNQHPGSGTTGRSRKAKAGGKRKRSLKDTGDDDDAGSTAQSAQPNGGKKASNSNTRIIAQKRKARREKRKKKGSSGA